MRWTRASVEEYSKSLGFEPIQIDGIPEGFSWRKPNVTIKDTDHTGGYIAFIPLGESIIESSTEKDLLTTYNFTKKNGK